MISKLEFGDIRSISGCFRIKQDITGPKYKGCTVAGDFTGISWSQFRTVIFSDMSSLTNKNCDMPANLQRMPLRALAPVPAHEKVSNAVLCHSVWKNVQPCNLMPSPSPVTLCAACVVRLAASESFPLKVFTCEAGHKWGNEAPPVNWRVGANWSYMKLRVGGWLTWGVIDVMFN